MKMKHIETLVIILGIALPILIYGAVAYVAIHFLVKYW